MEQGEEVAEAVLHPLREGEAELERQCEREGVPVPKGEGLRVTLPLPEREGQGEAVGLLRLRHRDVGVLSEQRVQAAGPRFRGAGDEEGGQHGGSVTPADRPRWSAVVAVAPLRCAASPRGSV